MKCLSITLVTLFFSSVVMADVAGLVKKTCKGSPVEVIDKLSAVLEKKGIGIVKRFDHQNNAKRVNLKMDESILLIFGNPKLGTHFFKAEPSSAIDLPMKALAYKDKSGKTVLAYNDPAYIVKRHGVKGQEGVMKKMQGALKKFSAIACE